MLMKFQQTAISVMGCLRPGSSKACQLQEAKVFRCNQLLLVGVPLESHATVADLSSYPRIDVKSLEWISRSGKVCCLKWLFHLLWKWVSVLSAIGQTVPEQDLPLPAEVLEHKNCTSSQTSSNCSISSTAT